MSEILEPSVVNGQPRELTAEELTEIAASQASLQADIANLTAAASARAMVELRMKRDRWLAQTDAFFIDPLPSDFPPARMAEIVANRAAWLAFRQALRDYPATVEDPLDPPPFPAQPPAPSVYLT
jgi:hypothetical protein